MDGEFKKIDWIRKFLKRSDPRVIVDIGDDAAVLRTSLRGLVATVDAQVEGVHFDRAYATPQDVGYRSLAVNLSDLAAMGARPRFALVSLALPDDEAEAFYQPFFVGLRALARKCGVSIIGGNLSGSPKGIFVDVTLLGEPVDKPLLRSSAKVGDCVVLAGGVGRSAAGLALLQRLGRATAMAFSPGLCRAHLRPTPQLELGMYLAARRLATSAIDVSDGLSSELAHLAKSSQVRIEVENDALQSDATLRKAAHRLACNSGQWVWNGGEDYALLFTVRPRHLPGIERRFGKTVRAIGKVTEGKPGVWIRANGHCQRLQPGGFEHFHSP